MTREAKAYRSKAGVLYQTPREAIAAVLVKVLQAGSESNRIAHRLTHDVSLRHEVIALLQELDAPTAGQ